MQYLRPADYYANRMANVAIVVVVVVSVVVVVTLVVVAVCGISVWRICCVCSRDKVCHELAFIGSLCVPVLVSL